MCSDAGITPGQSIPAIPNPIVTATDGTGRKGLSKGAIAGIVLAAVVGVLWAALGFALVRKKLQQTNLAGYCAIGKLGT